MPNEWLYVVEPIMILLPNDLNAVRAVLDEYEKEEVVLILYTMGYWRLCRDIYANQNKTEDLFDIFYRSEKSKPGCYQNWDMFLPSKEMVNAGKLMPEIIQRIRFTVVAHLVSIFASSISLVISWVGIVKHDARTLCAAILWILAALLINLAVMHFICVVDDEMAPRLKTTPEGDPSKYKYWYGWIFYIGSFAFLAIVMSGLGNLVLFLRRYPSIESKLSMVPGLRAQVEKAMSSGSENGSTATVAETDAIALTGKVGNSPSRSPNHRQYLRRDQHIEQMMLDAGAGLPFSPQWVSPSRIRYDPTPNRALATPIRSQQTPLDQTNYQLVPSFESGRAAQLV